MVAYRFRITFEDHDEVFREIEIRSNQTFADLHSAIQASIKFDNVKRASYFMSNDLWKKGDEITNRPLSENDNAVALADARLSDYILDPHQKIYHTYDGSWLFYIELIKIIAENPATSYPTCVRIQGDAPKQYAVIEPPKGTRSADELLEEDFLLDGEEPTVEDVEDSGNYESEDESDDTETYGEAVDEEEYDNIEDTPGENFDDESR